MTPTDEAPRGAATLQDRAPGFDGPFDAAADGMVVADEGRITRVNRAFAAMLGHDAAELVGRALARCCFRMMRLIRIAPPCPRGRLWRPGVAAPSRRCLAASPPHRPMTALPLPHGDVAASGSLRSRTPGKGGSAEFPRRSRAGGPPPTLGPRAKGAAEMSAAERRHGSGRRLGSP